MRSTELTGCSKTGKGGDPRGWMEREIDREYAFIKDAVYSDPRKPFTNEQFETAVENMRIFARIRPSNIVDQVNRS